MDRYSSTFSSCPLAVMAAGVLADTTDVPATGDSAPSQNGSDLWYSLGFGMSSMFFSPTFSECHGSR